MTGEFTTRSYDSSDIDGALIELLASAGVITPPLTVTPKYEYIPNPREAEVIAEYLAYRDAFSQRLNALPHDKRQNHLPPECDTHRFYSKDL